MKRVLVVDDEKDCLNQARSLLEAIDDLDVVMATNGHDALNLLNDCPSSIVVTDLHMPEMNGLRLLEAVREQYPLAPVVVMTAHGSEEIAAEALNAGASGYVQKRLLSKQLLPIVQKVLNSAVARHARQQLEAVLDSTETRFELGNDSELMQPVIGYLQEKVSRLLPVTEHELLRIGLALDEALTNAIYHGNLEVSSELKELDGETFHAVADERREQSPFNQRRVYVTGRVSNEEFVCIIRDEGNGFRLNSVPDPLAEENLGKASGRGLLLIRQFMDEVSHNEAANEIRMVKRPQIVP